MSKEFIIAGVLLSISTVLKICSVIALYQFNVTIEEPEHSHQDQHIIIKKERQKTCRPF